MKSAFVKAGLLLALVSLSACGPAEELTVEEGAQAPDTSSVEAGEPVQAAAICFYYTCPRTGRSYGGSTHYEARHRCELNCGDFCTYDGNICA